MTVYASTPPPLVTLGATAGAPAGGSPNGASMMSTPPVLRGVPLSSVQTAAWLNLAAGGGISRSDSDLTFPTILSSTSGSGSLASSDDEAGSLGAGEVKQDADVAIAGFSTPDRPIVTPFPTSAPSRAKGMQASMDELAHAERDVHKLSRAQIRRLYKTVRPVTVVAWCLKAVLALSLSMLPAAAYLVCLGAVRQQQDLYDLIAPFVWDFTVLALEFLLFSIPVDPIRSFLGTRCLDVLFCCFTRRKDAIYTAIKSLGHHASSVSEQEDVDRMDQLSGAVISVSAAKTRLRMRPLEGASSDEEEGLDSLLPKPERVTRLRVSRKQSKIIAANSSGTEAAVSCVLQLGLVHAVQSYLLGMLPDKHLVELTGTNCTRDCTLDMPEWSHKNFYYLYGVVLASMLVLHLVALSKPAALITNGLNSILACWNSRFQTVVKRGRRSTKRPRSGCDRVGDAIAGGARATAGCASRLWARRPCQRTKVQALPVVQPKQMTQGGWIDQAFAATPVPGGSPKA